MRQAEITRAEQMAEAVQLVRGLLGDRPATKVEVYLADLEAYLAIFIARRAVAAELAKQERRNDE